MLTDFLDSYPIIPLLLSFASTVGIVLYYTYFWQLKEYRWDRMTDFLSTKSGKDKIISWPLVMRFWLLIILILALLFAPGVLARFTGSYLDGAGYLLMLSIVVIDLLIFCWRVLRRKFYRPVWTAKAMLIVLLSILTSFIPWLIIKQTVDFRSISIGTTYAAMLSPLANALVIALFYPLTQFSKARKLAAANRKIAQLQGLKVIGITGSYGKSSVKEFLSQMLEKKFNVLKTPGNTNTEIGVAEVVLRDLKAEHEVFIVEAGAYKIGEIKKIAEMVKPRIGIITAVKDAHLGLFGSLENIKKAKFELIESLPEFGVAIFNNDNAGSADLAKRATQKVIKYGTDQGADLKAEKLTADIDGVSFEVKGVKLQSPLPGLQNINNILGAMAAAMELGMKLEELVEPVAKLKLREHTLTVKKVSDQLVLIDDTYNANPDGVIAGLEYLNLYRDWQKIVVFPGMLELGEKTAEEHVRVAEKMAEICDLVILTSHDFDEFMMEKFAKKNHQGIRHFIENQNGIVEFLKEKIKAKKSVLLFVSRGAETVIKKLSQ